MVDFFVGSLAPRPIRRDCRVTAEDKRRANLYSKLGKKDYDNPEMYHLVLNMSRINLDVAFNLVCDLVRS